MAVLFARAAFVLLYSLLSTHYSLLYFAVMAIADGADRLVAA